MPKRKFFKNASRPAQMNNRLLGKLKQTNKKKKPTEDGSKDRQPERKTEKLPEQPGMRLGNKNPERIKSGQRHQEQQEKVLQVLAIKKKTWGNAGPLQKEMRDMVTWDLEKNEVLSDLFALVFIIKCSSNTT